MRPDHILAFCFVPIVQAVLILTGATSGPRPKTILATLALVVPIALYLWALSDAPLVPKCFRRTRFRGAIHFVFLGLLAVGLTAGGLVIGLEALAANAAAN